MTGNPKPFRRDSRHGTIFLVRKVLAQVGCGIALTVVTAEGVPVGHPVVTIDKLTQLLDEFVDRVTAAEHAVALSPDGLLLAVSRGVDAEQAEQLASVVAGLESLAMAAAEHAGTGSVRQVIVQMQRAFLFVTATRGGAILAVRFAADTEVDVMAYEVALAAGRADLHLPTFPVPAPRQENLA
jgi:predicted regulator of Ras-like GTPase activity (Roadblock/LC7/MglB family)